MSPIGRQLTIGAGANDLPAPPIEIVGVAADAKYTDLRSTVPPTIYFPARQRVDGEANCGSFDVPVTKSTCTHHFKVLREAGVIHQRQEGTARLNTLRRADLDNLRPLDALNLLAQLKKQIT